MKRKIGLVASLLVFIVLVGTQSQKTIVAEPKLSKKNKTKETEAALVVNQKEKIKRVEVIHKEKREISAIQLELPRELHGKVLLSFSDKRILKEFYSNKERIELAVSTLSNTNDKIQGDYGLNRIKSIDFLEKSLRYRDNPFRSKIVDFIEEFINIGPKTLKDITSQKFFLGDQLEMLEILAYNYPIEFHRLQENSSNEVLVQMFRLVEHHAKK